jgi:hypothetical protein
VFGRLFVFCEHDLHVVNPETLAIEDTHEGASVLNRYATCKGKDGLLWGDENNLFLYDGREIRRVGDPILATDLFGNLNAPVTPWPEAQAGSVRMAYDWNLDAYVVAFTNQAGENAAWVLMLADVEWTDEIPKARWTYVELPSGALGAIWTDRDGSAALSIGFDMQRLMAGTGQRSWEWASKKIGGEAPTQRKVFYEAFIKGDVANLGFMEADDGQWRNAPLDTTDPERTVAVVNKEKKLGNAPPWGKSYTLQLSLKGDAGDEVESVAITYRVLNRGS